MPYGLKILDCYTLCSMKRVKHLLENNKAWAKSVTEKDPTFFQELSKQQFPKYLWIGCSDSRVPANQIVGQPPGEVFVHRNIANIVVHDDLNCLSVIQFAVDVLGVKDIIVCGHYGCSGVRAALRKDKIGLADKWLSHLHHVCELHSRELDSTHTEDEIHNLLCEFNVIEQVKNVSETSILQDAWKRGQEISVHGWIYGLEDGLIRDLKVSRNA